MSVIIETTLGDITIDLFVDERPRCCLNFLKLCKVKYYNYCLFHSVQRNFVAQTGDPTGTCSVMCSRRLRKDDHWKTGKNKFFRSARFRFLNNDIAWQTYVEKRY